MHRIKELRESRHLSQQRLAIDMNISQAMISKYELGQSEPDIQMITKLASYFNVSSDYLLGISDSKICVTVINLSEDEKNILYDYKRMDAIQKIKVTAYMKGLLQE